jgi:hypothetical protein
MKKLIKFLFLEIFIFVLMGLITFIEMTHFNLFESFFEFIKTPSSWFVGFGLAYAFSNLFQKSIFRIFSKRAKSEEEREGDFFIGFLITIILTSLITDFIKDGAEYFLTNFFIYFHVIIMQCIIFLYILFKLKGNYEISGKYFLANEIIVLLYTLIILQFVIR